MGRSIPTAREIERSFQLACFITGEREAALQIAAKAAESWEVTCREQRKRPRSKKYADKLRQKLIMNGEHALQFLTYKFCEPKEKSQESKRQDGAPLVHPHFFVIRYIEHLLYKTVPHRSFHVTVGLCRLLYDYQKSEMVKIYDTLSQKDYRLEKDEQMYKDWKKFLIITLMRRFSGLQLDDKGQRGITRFVRMADQQQIATLVMNCLELFTPWGTSCVLLAEQKSWRQRVKLFEFTGWNPDKEHPVEEMRMHAVIDPSCFAVLTEALRLGSPHDRLSIPLFSLPGGSDELPPPPDPRNLPSLTAEELFDIADRLTQNRRKRKTSQVRTLSVEVEGVERAMIDTRDQTSVRLVLKEDDDLIQVFTRDGGTKLLLGSLLLSGSGALEDEEPWRGSIKLPRGKALRIVVTSSREHAGGVAGTRVEIQYKRTRPFFVWMTSLVSVWRAFTQKSVLIPAGALSFVIAVALLFGFLQQKEKQHSHVTQTLAPEQAVKRAEPSPAKMSPPKPPAVSSGNKGRRAPAQPKRVVAPDALRVVSLTGVRRIFVSSGPSEPERHLRNALIEELSATGRFTIVDSGKKGDGTLSAELVRGGTITVQLVSRRQEVLWHKVVRFSVGEDPSSARVAAADIIRTLLADDESLKRVRGASHP
jgi:hypothetical protein